jgi:fibronectin type 3 domain-containing protein
VTAASSTGTGFTVIGATFPLTLNVGQTATLNVQFDPAATGAVTGKLTIASNSSTGATTTVSLSGTGLSHQVQLSWNAPSGSGATIAGYRVYRATSGTSSYQLLNSALNSQMTFVDSTVHSSTSYQYYVTTVNSSGLESVPSNTATVSVP